MKVFIAGATGQTGRRIVQELVRRDIPVKALVRNLETAREILPPEAELVIGDVLNPSSLYTAIGDSKVVLCATGARPNFDFTGPYKVDYLGTKNLAHCSIHPTLILSFSVWDECVISLQFYQHLSSIFSGKLSMKSLMS